LELRKIRLDRALAIFAVTGDGVLKDRATFLNSQAAVYTHRGEWRKAEEVLRSAVTAADSEMRLDPVALETLLVNSAYVLRKNHRREARAAEARAATLYPGRTIDAVVDASELLPKSKAAKY
jgi:hypothetical protein